MLQFLLKRKSVILISILFLISVTLFARNIERRESLGYFDDIVVRVFAPPLKFSALFLKKASQLWNEYAYLVNLRSENAYLQNLIKTLQLENQVLREEGVENRRLRELLAFKKKLPYTLIPAEIIGRDPSSWFRTLLIDKGSADGVRRGLAVITALGLVGQVFEVNRNTSKVLLLVDGDSAIDVLTQRSRAKGIIEGGAGDLCELHYVAKTEDVNIGDVVITSGLNEVLPKGIVVGEVVRVDKNNSGFFQFVEVKPAVDSSKLEEVLIVLK
ncbi:MAG: rod shape-determining protein MreC [Proteobacteria bacterium]|nr:rod shape-determining protein MreC [Pseudomonadota bacterium]